MIPAGPNWRGEHGELVPAAGVLRREAGPWSGAERSPGSGGGEAERCSLRAGAGELLVETSGPNLRWRMRVVWEGRDGRIYASGADCPRRR